MGTLTVSSETAFAQPAETIYNFVSDPRNWPKAYPGSVTIEGIERLPLEIGDIWSEGGHDPDGTRAVWRLITAVPGKKFVFQSVGTLAGGTPADPFDGLWTIAYSFTEPGQGVTLFHRSMTLEIAKGAAIPAQVLATFQPRFIDMYHAKIAKLLEPAASVG